MKAARQTDTGSLILDSGKLRFQSNDYGSWEVNLNQLALIGEYTTEDGPMIEDHFFVLVSKHGEEFEFPVTAVGVETILQTISQILNAKITPRLILSTVFASRIMAPREIEGQPLYSFETVKRPFLLRLFSAGRVSRVLSSNAKAALQSTS